MPRLALLAPVLMMAACSTTGAPLPARSCASSAASVFIGRPANSQTAVEILRATHSARLRWAPPGAALTMDFRIDRVTVRLRSDGRITRIDCG